MLFSAKFCLNPAKYMFGISHISLGTKHSIKWEHSVAWQLCGTHLNFFAESNTWLSEGTPKSMLNTALSHRQPLFFENALMHSMSSSVVGGPYSKHSWIKLCNAKAFLQWQLHFLNIAANSWTVSSPHSSIDRFTYLLCLNTAPRCGRMILSLTPWAASTTIAACTILVLQSLHSPQGLSWQTLHFVVYTCFHPSLYEVSPHISLDRMYTSSTCDSCFLFFVTKFSPPSLIFLICSFKTSISAFVNLVSTPFWRTKSMLSLISAADIHRGLFLFNLWLGSRVCILLSPNCIFGFLLYFSTSSTASSRIGSFSSPLVNPNLPITFVGPPL